jgi:SAM-dependent methyltransferase
VEFRSATLQTPVEEVSMATVPERISWAVQVVDPQPDERLLEVGCGPGAAAELVCGRLTSGHLLATDRSAVAVARTSDRNQAHVAEGRLTVQQAALHELSLPEGELDKAFCVNVNLFWVGRADAELALLRRALRSGGRLFILYGADGPTGSDKITPRISEAVRAAGYADAEVVTADHGIGVTARVL